MYGKIGNSKAYMNLKSSYIFYNHYFVAVEWNIQNAYEATLNCLYNQVRGLIGKSQLYLQVGMIRQIKTFYRVEKVLTNSWISIYYALVKKYVHK